MGKFKSNLLFNLIAPFYGLFYYYQKKRFARTIEKVKSKINILAFETVLDVGCGTGALCSVLNSKGLCVTGVDPAIIMMDIAMNKKENNAIKFLKANVLDGLPFKDEEFDIAITSYVAHGLKTEERKKMYAEMSRVVKNYVIIHDYNKKRSILTSIIELLEGGNYFKFIKQAENEMKECFLEVMLIQVDVKANWYVCKPIKPEKKTFEKFKN